MRATGKHLPLLPAIALVLVAALSTGCFLPVPGFRDNKKPPDQTPSQTNQPDSTNRKNHFSKKRGMYHTVRRGETIYRISKMYGVSQKDIIRANKIKDITKVYVGQVLFIPGARKLRNDPGARTPPPQHTTAPPPKRSIHARCPPGSIKFIWPAKGKLTSGFGIRNGRQHDGIDIANKIGTPINAVADGVVIYAGRLGGYGLIVILKHEGSFKTIYAHNRKNLVKKGDTVRQGQKIAELGNSGNATGPHLHFEVRCGQEATDPIPYLPK